jgi:DNA polymerase III subunit delta'
MTPAEAPAVSVWTPVEGSRSIEGLRRVLSTGTSPHSWLLLGPRGSGKRAVAMAMAAAFNCREAPGVGCGECSSCRRILRVRHPDVHHVVPEGPIISVDVIRESIIPEAARSPFEGATKVFIIEEAERMNDSAQNALLKTLEEPQPDTVFILISDNEEELLETVRSRCHPLRLEPVPEGRITDALSGDVSEAAARAAARAAGGDLERARSLARGAGEERRRLWLSIPGRLHSSVAALEAAADIVEHARSVVRDHQDTQKEEVVELAEALGEARGTAAARNALARRHKRQLRRLEEEILGEALETLADWYRDVLVVREGGSEATINMDRLEELGAWAASDIPSAALVEAGQRCIEARSAITRNANPPLAIEAALLDVTRLVDAQ